MKQKGIRLIRFTNEEVMDSIDKVVAQIRNAVASLLSPRLTPYPLSTKWRGEDAKRQG